MLEDDLDRSVDLDGAGIRLDQGEQHVGDRGLSTAGIPDNSECLSVPDRKGHVFTAFTRVFLMIPPVNVLQIWLTLSIQDTPHFPSIRRLRLRDRPVFAGVRRIRTSRIKLQPEFPSFFLTARPMGFIPFAGSDATSPFVYG